MRNNYQEGLNRGPAAQISRLSSGEVHQIEPTEQKTKTAHYVRIWPGPAYEI